MQVSSLAISLAASGHAAERFVFPDDRCVLDVKKHLGAKGDGVADDSDILQRALDIGSGRDKNTVKEHGWIGWSLFSAWKK